jgi:hypothetical protein
MHGTMNIKRINVLGKKTGGQDIVKEIKQYQKK